MKILSRIALVVFLMTIVACAEDKRKLNGDAPQPEQTGIQKPDSSHSDSINGQRIVKNFLPVNKEQEVETNGEDSAAVQNGKGANIMKNPERGDEDADVHSMPLLLLGTVAVGLLSIFTLLLSVYNFFAARKRENDLLQRIEKNEKDNEKKWKQVVRKFGECAPDKDCKDISEKVENLTARVNGLAQDIKDPRRNRPMPTDSQEQMESETNIRSTGYFGIPRGTDEKLIFFNEHTDFLTDKSYFKMEYIDELNCMFYPFDLEKLRGSDSIKRGVDFTGCSMQYAKSMIVKRKGSAVYDQENGYWKLVERAEVELLN